MHYLCLIYVLRSSNYLSNVPSYVKTWKLSAVTHDTPCKHISGQDVTGDLHSLSRWSPIRATARQQDPLSELTGNHKRDIAQNDAMQFNTDEGRRHHFFSMIKVFFMFVCVCTPSKMQACLFLGVCWKCCLYAPIFSDKAK